MKKALLTAAAIAVKKMLDVSHVNLPSDWVDSKTKLKEIASILSKYYWNLDFGERYDVDACAKDLKEKYGVAPTNAVA